VLQRERALDFGCGLGRITRALAQHFDESVGVDISEDMVRRARELNVDAPGASFVVNVASDLARFDDAGYDVVFSSIVLQHVPDRPTIKGYIAEFCRVTRPGGLVILQLPSHIYRTQWRRLYAGLRRLGVGAPFCTGGCGGTGRNELHPRTGDRAAGRVRERAPVGRRHGGGGGRHSQQHLLRDTLTWPSRTGRKAKRSDHRGAGTLPGGWQPPPDRSTCWCSTCT
jgi:SAM-dependent methyltransferase